MTPRPRSFVAPTAVALILGLGLTGASAAPGDDPVEFPDAVEPAEPAIPKEGPVGAPDRAQMDEPVRADGPAAEAPAQAVDDGPLTGFEERGGADWTTEGEERRFLRALDRMSDQVSVRGIGRTPEGRRLDLVQVGAEERSAEEIAAGSSILFVCSQHGNEPAGRDGCLQAIRDLALDSSPATQRLLTRSTILFIPNANPDGRAANIRRNSQNVDLNRDHLALETSETQAVAKVVRDYAPDAVHDAHEYGGAPDIYDRELIRLWPRNLNVDEDVRDLAIALAEDYIDPLLQFEGYTTGEYGIIYGPDGRPIAQVAGSEDERIMRNMMGLRHSVGQLIESLVNDFDDDETETENKLRRVRTQVLAIQASLALVLEQGSALQDETESAAEEAAAEGAAGDMPYFFAGADNMLPSLGSVDLSPPCAYTMSVEDFRGVRRTLNLHGIETSRGGGTVTVSMAQAAQPVIPLLLDERANYNLVDASPVECGS